MKNLLIGLLFIFLSFSCSNSDDCVTDFYFVTLNNCRGESGVKYCITKDSYNILTQMKEGDECYPQPSLILTNGQTISGSTKYGSWGKTCEDCSYLNP